MLTTKDSSIEIRYLPANSNNNEASSSRQLQCTPAFKKISLQTAKGQNASSPVPPEPIESGFYWIHIPVNDTDVVRVHLLSSTFVKTGAN